MKRLSANSDARCDACGEPAADGLSDNGLWCEKHGRIRAVDALERACFDMLGSYGRKEFAATLAAVEAYNGTAEPPLRSDELAHQIVPL